MYFDQYFIKPAFATLTSLLRTYQALNLTAAFSIYLQDLVSAGLIHPACVFYPFQSFIFQYP